MILIPLMDMVVYPALRRAGIRFTPIKRIMFGFFLGTAAMVYACVLQFYMSVPSIPLFLNLKQVIH